MIKSELVVRIGKKFPQLPEKVVTMSVNMIVDTMSEALADGQRIEIRDFGGFALRYRAPRNAHNPKTGTKVFTLPKYTLHFKPGKEMRERVDANKKQPVAVVS